jgi:ABC-type sugar transport system permease subunit
MDFIGLENFKYAFRVNPNFNRFLVEEILRMIYSMPSILIFSFFSALLLNQKFKGRGLVRAIFFLPVILSSGVIVGIEFSNELLTGVQTAIEDAASDISITATLEEILVDSGGVASGLFGAIFYIVDGIYAIAIASGIQIIIFLSGLQTISPSMYEAAQIEGCTAWESFWKITFPMVSSLILVNIVYTVIDFFNRTDNTVMEEIQLAVGKLEYGQSSAMSWIYFVCVIAILGIVSLIISKRVYYYE